MARPYSADLRQRVLRECEKGTARRAEIAARFSISESTLYNWLKQARHEDRRAPKPSAGGRKARVDGHHLEILHRLVCTVEHATLAEYVERFAALTGLRVSISTMHRMLRRLDVVHCRFSPASRPKRCWQYGQRSRR
jgi:transposase